jgi:hypothetical protein
VCSQVRVHGAPGCTHNATYETAVSSLRYTSGIPSGGGASRSLGTSALSVHVITAPRRRPKKGSICHPNQDSESDRDNFGLGVVIYNEGLCGAWDPVQVWSP